MLYIPILKCLLAIPCLVCSHLRAMPLLYYLKVLLKGHFFPALNTLQVRQSASAPGSGIVLSGCISQMLG